MSRSGRSPQHFLVQNGKLLPRISPPKQINNCKVIHCVHKIRILDKGGVYIEQPQIQIQQQYSENCSPRQLNNKLTKNRQQNPKNNEQYTQIDRKILQELSLDQLLRQLSQTKLKLQQIDSPQIITPFENQSLQSQPQQHTFQNWLWQKLEQIDKLKIKLEEYQNNISKVLIGKQKQKYLQKYENRDKIIDKQHRRYKRILYSMISKLRYQNNAKQSIINQIMHNSKIDQGEVRIIAAKYGNKNQL